MTRRIAEKQTRWVERSFGEDGVSSISTVSLGHRVQTSDTRLLQGQTETSGKQIQDSAAPRTGLGPLWTWGAAFFVSATLS